MFSTNISETVKHLLILNVLVFLLSENLNSLSFIFDTFALHDPLGSPNFKPWQIITHMFMHGGFQHLLFNMLTLFFIGSTIENYIGQKGFLQIYLVAGLAAVVPQLLFFNAVEFYYQTEIPYVMLGASGAIAGLLGALAKAFPEQKVMLYFFIPLKIKTAFHMLIAFSIFAQFSVFFGLNIAGDTAHLAHAGGAIAGYFMMGNILKQRFKIN